MTDPRHDPDAEARRRIVRRAGLYSAAFLVAGLLVAVIGAAFVAWLLTFRGQPFMRTWLIATVIIIVPGLLAAIWKLIRGQ